MTQEDILVLAQTLSDLIEKVAGENDKGRWGLFTSTLGFLMAKRGRVRPVEVDEDDAFLDGLAKFVEGLPDEVMAPNNRAAASLAFSDPHGH